jgi:hypothetical protein
MRCGAAWRDVRILNASARGLGLHSPDPPERGTYVEVRQGPIVIVARVVWANGSRFGVRTQTAVPIDSLAAGPNAARKAVEQQPTGAERIERRRSHRNERQHEASRAIGNAMEFAFVGILAACAAGAAFTMVRQTVEAPMDRLQVALGR